MLKKKIKRQKGIAILYALSLCLIFSLMIAWSSRFLLNSINDSGKEFRKSGMAVNVAKAGAEDAYFWFTKQNNQPVTNLNMANKYASVTPVPSVISSYGTVNSFFGYADSAFFPKYNSDPNLSETDDESIGLVRDIPLTDVTTGNLKGTNSLWGHYEVKRQNTNNNETSITGMVVGNKNNNDPRAVHDISHLVTTQQIGSGNNWRIFSTGYIYRRNNFDKNADGTFVKKYNEAPNVYVEQATASIDILRISVNTSMAKAAIVLPNASKIVVSSSASDSSINGTDGNGVYAKQGNISSISGSVTGTPSLDTNSSLDISPTNIFSITETELKAIATKRPNSASSTDLAPNDDGTMGDMTIIFADNDLTFTPANPLKGGGLLYVKGNLKFSANSGSFFSGIIYVKGNVNIERDNSISGSLIMEDPLKTCTIGQGAGSQKVTVEYSKKILDNVQKKLALYRTNNFSFRVYDSNK